MNTNTLIAGPYTAVLNDFVQESLELGRRVIVATDRDAPQLAGAGEIEESLAQAPWNPQSAISPRAVILAARNHVEAIDEAVLVLPVSADGSTFHEEAIPRMERRVQNEISAVTILLRELVRYFDARGEGLITIALHGPHEADLPPINSLVYAGIRALGDALFSYYRSEAFTIRGFLSSVATTRRYARFVLAEAVDRPRRYAGKWSTYTGRHGILGLKRDSG